MVKISKKTKVIVLSLVGVLSFLYYKFFGGRVQGVPEGTFIVGQTEKELKEMNILNVEKVAVAYADTPEQGVQEVINRTGNLDFIKPGQKVLIKPNVNSDDPAPGTTEPKVIAEVVRLAKQKGAYVIVGDLSNPRYDTIEAMKKTGIYQAAQSAGADEIVSFEDYEWIRVKPENASNWPRGFRIPKLATEVDHIISVPVLHTHFIASHSLAIKNLVGLIHIDDRMVFHASPKLDEMITEIALAINPSLNIIEGTKSFIDGGPFSGTVSEPKVYLASKDLLAADVVGVELLKKDGANLKWNTPWESRLINRAVELGIGFNKDVILEEVERLIK